MEYIAALIILLAVVGIISALIDENSYTPPTMVVIIAVLAVILACSVLGEVGNNTKYTYQVKEFERNTVFNVTDSIGGYNPKDTIWINMTDLSIDPRDSTAMMGVIVKEIK